LSATNENTHANVSAATPAPTTLGATIASSWLFEDDEKQFFDPTNSDRTF